MDIRFFGAVRNVTGSMHLLTIGGKRILLECGLVQGKRQESFERNRNFPFDPASVDAMVLSHAHIDHSGNIPLLVKGGFRGSIFCTHATQDLVKVMLRDSGHIQEKDAEFMTKRHLRNGLPPVQPLYTIEDAEEANRYLVGVGYGRQFQITEQVRLTLVDAGHIFGSAIVVLDVQEKKKQVRITFTGDLGRKNLPVIRDPVAIEETDIFITESTYGDRDHDPIENMKNELQGIVQETVSRGGKVIVPAFSLGRTQELVYVLHQLFKENTLPEIPIFVDSPLSMNVTEVFRLHPECFDRETHREFLDNNQDPFGFYRLQYIRQTEDSKKLNTFKGSCIIISASGMCEAGRILHHLANNIPDPRNTVLIVGFMAEHTLGRRLVERQPEVSILGEVVPLRAKVEIMNGFSAHAGRQELFSYFQNLNKPRLKQVFVIHGESGQSEALVDMIQERFDRTMIPVVGESYTL